MQERIQIPNPRSAGLMLSYRCPAECLHCMYACSPKWSEDWIPSPELKTILEQLSGRITPSPNGPNSISLNYGLHLTGGEPFLNFDGLCQAVEMARQMDIPSLFVETNCFWCKNDQTTRKKLDKLKKLGLQGILISVNPFFLEQIPFARVKRGVKISRQVFGNNTLVYQQEYFRRFSQMGIEGKMDIQRYIELWGSDFSQNVEFFITGRAPYKIMEYDLGQYPKYPASKLLKITCRPPFLRDWHNHVDNYGNLIPGYCGGLSLGDARQLDELLAKGISAGDHPVLSRIVTNDFEGLLELAETYGYGEREDGYYSKCHLCIDVRKKLCEEGEFRELTPKEFYEHLDYRRQIQSR